MNDAMKMLIGYDPDEVVEESVRAAREAIRGIIAELGSAVDVSRDEETQDLYRVIQSLSGGLVAAQHHIAALVNRPAGDTTWPARQIYEGIQGAYVDEIQSWQAREKK